MGGPHRPVLVVSAPPASDPTPASLARLALDVARRAGDLIAGADTSDLDVVAKSTPTDLVTRYDRASEELIVNALLASRPDDGVLGEEGNDVAGTSGVRWIIDPIDGTTNFAYGLPGFAVSIGVEQDRRLVAGAVVVPSLADEFVAWTGGGAWRNGEPISVRPPVELAHSLVGTGFAYDPERRIRQADVVARIIGRVRDIRRSGAAALDLCSVACGRLDGYFEVGLGPWDLAAGTVIATEAGALVTGVARDDLIVCAHPVTHAALTELLADASAHRV